MLVIVLLTDWPRSFNELRRSIEGISQRMLTLTLRGLERDGLVTRTHYPSIPPRVEYGLTPLGTTLLEPVQALAAWAGRHRLEIQKSRDRHDAASALRGAKAEAAGAPSGALRHDPAGRP